MKVLILGASGMLGHALARTLHKRFELTGTIRRRNVPRGLQGIKLIDDFNTEDLRMVGEVLESERPDVVVNAVGVIKQVAVEADPLTMLKANSLLPLDLGRLSQLVGFRLVTVSTDCVFSGSVGLYSETDLADAVDLYGISKRLGEPAGANVLVLRTSIIGPEIERQTGLLEWFLSNRGGRVQGFRQVVFSGFPTVVLASLIGDLIEKHPNLSGLYHVSSEPIDKYRLLEMIRDAYQVDIDIIPVDEPVIDRSLDSSKFRAETGFQPLPWSETVEIMAAHHLAEG